MQTTSFLILLVAILLAQVIYLGVGRYKMRTYIRSITGKQKPKPDYMASFAWIIILIIAFLLMSLTIYYIWK